MLNVLVMKSITFRAVKNSNGYVRSAFVGNANAKGQTSRGMGIAVGLLAVAVAIACLLILTK